MRAQILIFCVVFCAVFSVFTTATARGKSHKPEQVVCLHVVPGTIQVDGLLDDWGETTGVTVGDNPADAGFTLRCAYDATKLYLSVNVTDDILLRSRDRKLDDHLVFRFGSGIAVNLTVFPAGGGFPHVIQWSDGKRRALALVDSLQPKGWSVELGLPLKDVPGWQAHAAGVLLDLEFDDADENNESTKRGGTIQVTTRLTFEDADAGFQKFLADLGLTQAQVRLDTSVDLGEGPRRMVVAGKVVGVLDDGYVYLELPVDNPRDVLEVRPVAYAGAKSMILARTVERGNGGSREILALWRLDGSRFNRVFAHEMTKQAGERKLVNSWKLVAGKRSLDLVITPGAAVGWTADTWNETPAEDMTPILLPWDAKKQEIWHLDASGVSGG